MPLSITTEIIKELRDATGISVMQCKHALEEAEGDMKKALAILKKTSSDIALKKGSREVKDGAVTIKLKDLPAQAGKKAVLVSLLCETDFVARNEDFTTLLGKLADIALSKGLEKMKVLAKDLIDPIIQKTGENIQLGDAYEVSNKDKGYLGSYVHNNKIAVITSLEGGSAELARDIAMHIAAMKPEEIKKKILDGKIGTYFKEKTLSEQAFIKDSGETVGHLLQKNKAKIKEIRQCSV